MNKTVLIADDNIDFCTTIAEIVSSMGFSTRVHSSPASAIQDIEENNKNIHLAFLDIEFGPGIKTTGLDILEFIRLNYSSIPVVMISGKGSIETAVRATKLGAINFIEKSIVSRSRIASVLESALKSNESTGEDKELLKFLNSQGIIAKGASMVAVADKIIRFGRTDLSVLITGETGTGKRLVAKALHNISRRVKKNLITVDIPNIPKDLLQSELFGHIKGSFSGATETKDGLFQKANGGTIFLDEIGEMSLDLQANLFIPVEERIVRKIGSTESQQLDIRFISATDRNLPAKINDGTFREQLYHRLRECEIYLPPLRERKEDIPDIANYYLKQHNQQFADAKYISQSAIEYLQDQTWQGNIRELAGLLRVVLQTVNSEQIEVHDFIKNNVKSHTNTFVPIAIPTPIELHEGTLKEDLAIVDRVKIEAALTQCNGNVSKTAAVLGVSRETMHNKIRKYSIDVKSFRKRN